MSTPSDLAARWPLAGDEAVRDELLAAYAEPGRGYHDLRHLAEVLDRLDELAAAGTPFDRVPVSLAAWFHDGVYDGRPGAEDRSAVWAETALTDHDPSSSPRSPGWSGSPRTIAPPTTTRTAAPSPTPTWRSWPHRRPATRSTSSTSAASTPTSATTTSGPGAWRSWPTCWPRPRCSTPPTPASDGSRSRERTSRPSCRLA